MSKLYLSAQGLLEDSYKLAAQVLDSGFRPTFMIAVWRGGAPMGIAVQEYLAYHGVETDNIAIRTSSYHGIDNQSKEVKVHGLNYLVKNIKPDHPVMKDFPREWTTPKDELYVIEKVWPNTEILATSVSERDGKLHPTFWTNKYGKARVFGTTYGHSNETFQDKVFLDAVINGMMWAATGK